MELREMERSRKLLRKVLGEKVDFCLDQSKIASKLL